jgi:hypothetical protein
MSKKQTTRSSAWEPPIDQEYESRVNSLAAVDGHVSDYAGQYAIERPQPAPRNNLVLPERPQSTAYALSAQDAAIMAQGGNLAGTIMVAQNQPVNSADARQVDSAITRDKASLLYSLAYALPAGLITLGLLVIVYLFRGGDAGAYFFTGLVVWGCALLAILYFNRGQGLHHSPSGIAHHDIDARVEESSIRADVAKHAIDAHIELLKHKWALEDKRNVK